MAQPATAASNSTTTSKKLPRVSLGLLTFGPPNTENFGTRISSIDTFRECLSYYASRGYTELDTARTYVGNQQEGWTGKALSRSAPNDAASPLANHFQIATKWYPYTPGDHHPTKLRAALETSLHKLNRPSVDLWYLHAPDRSVPFTDTLREVNALYREGKFRRLGLSNYAAWEVAEICMICEREGWLRPSVYQAMYNCLTRAIEEELVPCCRRWGVDLLVYNPLAGGVLSGKYKTRETPVDGGRYSSADRVVGEMYRQRYFKDANFEALEVIRPVAERLGLGLVEVALRWCVHHSALRVVDGNDGVVIGVSSFQQLEANLDALEKGPLPKEMVDVLDEAWKITKPTCALYWR